jgi:hypothetical protein
VSDFKEAGIFSTDFQKKIFRIKFQEICLVGAGLFLADGHDKANSRSLQFFTHTKKN